MAQDITIGLLLMHSQGVFHWDLKSLKTCLDQNMTLKIYDNGISKIKTIDIFTSLCSGQCFWIIILEGSRHTFLIRYPCTDKSDVYPLGRLFREIASCQVLYEGFDPDTHKDSVKSGEWLDIPSTCPVEFIELFLLWRIQNPRQRPPVSNLLFNPNWTTLGEKNETKDINIEWIWW